MLHFACPCGHTFESTPDRVVDNPARLKHPWNYFSVCRYCGDEAPAVAWQYGVLAAHGLQTGPKTPEGLAASASNLEGHPTPAEMELIRFNAMRHGLAARVAKFFPPVPGRYAECDGCEYEISRGCVPYKACLKQMEPFARYQAAAESKDPSLIQEFMADNQAALQSIINMMILAIARNGGPEIVTPEWYHDKDGGFHLARMRDEKTGEYTQFYKIEEHPLLKRLIDILSKNNMTLGDMQLTAKTQDEEQLIKGFLEEKKGEQEGTQAYLEHVKNQNETLQRLIERSYETKPSRVVSAEVIDAEVIRDE